MNKPKNPATTFRRFGESTPGVTAMLGMTPLQSYPSTYHGTPAVSQPPIVLESAHEAVARVRFLARELREDGLSDHTISAAFAIAAAAMAAEMFSVSRDPAKLKWHLAILTAAMEEEAKRVLNERDKM